MTKTIKGRFQRFRLPLVILIPTIAFALIEELVQLNVFSLDENCQCYPGLTVFGYAIQILFWFLILNVFLLPFHFSKIINKEGLVAFAVGEIIVYGWALLLFVGNFSISSPTPNLPVLISVVPVAILLCFGYALHYSRFFARLIKTQIRRKEDNARSHG
jgi:hypothetical protein